MYLINYRNALQDAAEQIQAIQATIAEQRAVIEINYASTYSIVDDPAVEDINNISPTDDEDDDISSVVPPIDFDSILTILQERKNTLEESIFYVKEKEEYFL